MRCFAILLLLTISVLGENTTGSAVWDRFSWGMTREDVRESYPQVINVDGVFHLEGFAVGDIPFRASLGFTGPEAGLAEINLDCLLAMPDDEAAGKVLEALREKYGPPSWEGREAFLQYLWQTPQVSVQLVWSPASDYSPPSLRIFLRKPAPPAAVGEDEP